MHTDAIATALLRRAAAKNGSMHSMNPSPSKNLRAAQAKCELAQRYLDVRHASVALTAPLSDEDCQLQSMPDASPTKWHLAHITWFFETFILERFEPDFKPFDARFRVLFNSYYQGVGERHPRAQRGLISRPSLLDVKRYRDQVDARIVALIEAGRDASELIELVTLGLHHEQQHQELVITDIKHALALQSDSNAYAKRWPMQAVRPQALGWFAYAPGLTELGFDATQDGPFCFDNETPRHRVFISPFELASRPASYGDYLAFMEDGGYQKPELWLSMGWDWVQEGQREAPLYWQRNPASGEWVHHTLQGRVSIDANTPVCHLSYFEADAFARWAGARLPTEAEWEHAARVSTGNQKIRGNFAERGAFHPLPQIESSAHEPVQMFGDVWEWTQSSYSPYPGYRALPGAVGEYNGKFMCNQHVLRGGSCATPASHIRASYRNFFPPQAQWQFSGVRLARDAGAPKL
jgi:ergothioneine biosynthesis protein EgtB